MPDCGLDFGCILAHTCLRAGRCLITDGRPAPDLRRMAVERQGTDDAAPSESGDALKKDAGKVRYDLIPVGPLRELARLYTIGAEKYAPRGWEQPGMDWSRIIAAMQRHTEAWRGGEQFDPVDGQHHLAAVAWCAFALMEYEQTHPDLDDRPAGVAAIEHAAATL